jgi:hypothetical protein
MKTILALFFSFLIITPKVGKAQFFGNAEFKCNIDSIVMPTQGQSQSQIPCLSK